MKKIAVILTGCGAMDGSEIHEATLSLFAIENNGAKYKIFALDAPQRDVVNHLTSEADDSQSRNTMIESARIARGNVSELSTLKVSDFDALIIPGGFGAAKNLFTYAYDGLNFTVNTEVERVVKEFHSAGKPIGTVCIAPMGVAKILGPCGVTLTLGPEDKETAAAIKKRFGATIVSVSRDEILIDSKNRVVSTPAYMYGDSTIVNIGRGTDAVVKAVLNMIK